MNTNYNLVTESNFKAELEQRIDSKGLNSILMQLVEICEEKAAHCAENWQDNILEACWTKTANKLDAFRIKIENDCPLF
jgi:hypothetical protein